MRQFRYLESTGDSKTTVSRYWAGFEPGDLYCSHAYGYGDWWEYIGLGDDNRDHMDNPTRWVLVNRDQPYTDRDGGRWMFQTTMVEDEAVGEWIQITPRPPEDIAHYGDW